MRVLVIGGTGFIGPHVVRRLVTLGHYVTIAHTGAHEADVPPQVTHLHDPAYQTIDRRHMAERADELRRQAPDVVLDMVPMIERDAQTAVSIFDGMAGRLVAISSQDVYRAYGRLHGKEPGPPDPVPLTEEAPLRERLYAFRGDTARPSDDPRRWLDAYDKILVERMVMSRPGLPATVLRLPMVYGPRDGHRIHALLKRMDDRRPAIVLDEGRAQWRWSRAYVENVADAIALAVVDSRAAGRIYNVGEEHTLSEAEWATQIGRAAGWDGTVIAVPADALPEHLRTKIDTIHHLEVSTERLRRELGYAEAVPRDEALQRTIAWERAHPPEQIDPAAFDYAAEDAVLARLDRAAPRQG